MSKSISIKEGDVSRKFRPVERLNVVTNDQQALWQPEDTFRTGTLHVSKNGIYIASLNGYAAYTEIDVRVTDKQGSDDPEAYDYITPDVVDYPDVWDDTSLDFDEDVLNDPEEWPDAEDWDESEYWDEQEESEESEDPEETEYDPYDPEKASDKFKPEKLKNVKYVDVKNPKEKKLKGTDPVSGREYEVTAEEPEDIEGEVGDGELSTELLPSAIHIVVWPAKRKYEEGETIDFSGIHVYLLDDRHRRFTTEQYPTGEIPFSELIFPVTIARAGGEEKYINSLPDDSPILTIATPPFPLLGGSEIRILGNYDWINLMAITSSVTIALFKNENGTVNTIFASSNSFEYGSTSYKSNAEIIPSAEDVVKNQNSVLFTQNNKTVYYGGYSVNGQIDEHPSTPINGNLQYGNLIAWEMIYGDVKEIGNNEIPVQWMRSDGKTLEDTFLIKVGEGGEPEPEPQNDPFANSYDFEWEGKYYNFNRKLAEGEVIYSDGTVYQTWIGGQSPPYTVPQAVSMKLCFQVNLSGSTHYSGGF